MQTLTPFLRSIDRDSAVTDLWNRVSKHLRRIANRLSRKQESWTITTDGLANSAFARGVRWAKTQDEDVGSREFLNMLNRIIHQRYHIELRYINAERRSGIDAQPLEESLSTKWNSVLDVEEIVDRLIEIDPDGPQIIRLKASGFEEAEICALLGVKRRHLQLRIAKLRNAIREAVL